MTKDELKTKLVGLSHRNDLTSRLDDFIDDATAMINNRFVTDVALEAGSDTNIYTEKQPLLYIYGAAISLYEHTKQGDDARYYKERWDEIASLTFLTFTNDVVINRVESA